MWTVIDTFTRIVSDILYVNSQTGPFKKYLSRIKKFSISHLYYGLIAGIVVVSACLVPLEQPLFLLTVSAVLGGLTMAIYLPILLYLNNFKLAKPLRPGWFTNLIMIFASVFYIAAFLYLLLKT